MRTADYTSPFAKASGDCSPKPWRRRTDFLQDYIEKKKEIKARLQDFKCFNKKCNKDIFRELCFCILTPQSRATLCDEAIRRLNREGLLFKGSENKVRTCLKGVRFPNNKAKYLIAARAIDIKRNLDTKDLYRTRDWLVKNVEGMGYKEASHFLRNIGFGNGLEILDRHILKNLKKFGVIKKIPASLSRKTYIEIESKMREFFKNLKIPMEEIDLLFWSKETGLIFK